MISFTTKINQRVLGEELSIVDEEHIIPASSPYVVKLIEVPLEEVPSSVSATADFVARTETTVNILAGEFKVDYIAGTVTFHSSDAGKTARVSYKGRGSVVDAIDINDIQTNLESVYNEVETARGSQVDLDTRLDGSLKEDGLLKDESVTPNTISTTITDDFTFPNDVTINGDFTVLGTTTTVVNETVENDLTVTDELIVNGNATLGNENTDTATIKGSLTIDNTLGTEIQINQKEVKQMVIEQLASNPVSPATGQVWYRTDINQFMGYNGSSIIIIG